MENVSREDVSTYTKDFWRYASHNVGVHDVGDVFMDWTSKSGITIHELEPVWININNDIAKAFNTGSWSKEALTFKSIEELSQVIDLVRGKQETGLPTTQLEEETSAEAEELLAKAEGIEDINSVGPNAVDKSPIDIGEKKLPIGDKLDQGLPAATDTLGMGAEVPASGIAAEEIAGRGIASKKQGEKTLTQSLLMEEFSGIE